MKHVLQKISRLVVLILASSTTVVASAADVTLPDPNYAGGRALTHILKVVAEQRLGLDVGVTRINSFPTIWKAMDAGKGDIDVNPEVWMPNQAGLVNEYVNDKGTVKLGTKPYQAIQGLCVTKMTAEKHGIKSVFDLISPENAKLFDTNGDGKGELYIGPVGWLSTNIEKVRARDYGYGENFELQVMEEAAAIANLDTAVTKNKPFVFQCYGPHMWFVKYELVVLDETPHSADKWNMIQPSDSSTWYEDSYVASASGETLVYAAYSRSLDDRAPTFARMVDNFAPTTQDVSQWVYEVGALGRDPQDMAEDWVANNAAKVDEWVK